MNKSAIGWLYGELPGLVAQGIISSETADRLRAHYGSLSGSPKPAATKQRFALVITSVIGAILIGLGITLLVAHNWPSLSRPTRMIIAFAPLAAGQLASGFTILFRRDSAAWREASGTFTVCGLATCIALIGQTYHLPGNLENFLLTCMVLAVPLAYLLNSAMVAVLYLIALPFWTGMRMDIFDGGIGFFPMAALIAPYVIWTLWRQPNGLKAINLAFFGGGALAIGLNMAAAPSLENVGFLLNTSLFTAFYLLHLVGTPEEPPSWSWPLRIVGAIGQVVLAILLTFGGVWRESVFDFRFFTGEHVGSAVMAWALVVVFFGACTALLIRAVAQRRLWKVVPGLMPFIMALMTAYAAVFHDAVLPITVFNAFILVVGIAAIAHGVQEDRLLVVNWGILLVSALIAARFFDSDVPFVLRGLAFIVLGIAFLAVNVFWLGRKRRAPGAAA